jgi:Na+-transporting methylmalonyl-CoA/oxaloacetate decarboxylase gamma subunit
LGNVNAITTHIRNFTSVFAVLIVGLGISLLVIFVLLFCLRRKNRTIAVLKEKRKEEKKEKQKEDVVVDLGAELAKLGCSYEDFLQA